MFDQMFVVVQILSNTIKHDQTRCPNGKMFGHQTMFGRVLSPDISRLERARGQNVTPTRPHAP